MLLGPPTTAEPCAAGATTATLVKTPVMELVRSIADVTPDGTETERAAVVGAGGLTVIDTVAGVEVPPAPVAVYWKLSGPK
jgi:hypothetical protein